MKKKITPPKSPRAVVALQPSQPVAPTTVVTSVPGVVQPVTKLVPPLERALTDFAEELRKELSATRDQVQQLKTELAALRTQYNAHTHAYTKPVTGSGGNLWFSLSSLKHYIDDDKENFDSWGLYFREGGVTGNPPESRTGLPGA